VSNFLTNPVTLQYKALENSIKDIDTGKGIVKFAFAHFSSIDSDGDIIVKGAYTKTIAEGKDRIYHYKNHDPNIAIGKPLEIYETSEHAVMVSQLSKNSSGRDALIEYQEGIIKEHSQGFYIPKGKQERKSDANYIYEVTLAEASTLTKWAANPNTPVFEVKAQQLETLITELTKRLKVGTFSDNYLSNIEKQINELQEAISLLKAGTSTFQEPSVETVFYDFFKPNLKNHN